ncbi:MAG: phosphohydrolase [Anaerolineae bacterium]|nr:phosphohydrolase [Anaerolineae bacterium]
MSEPDWDGVKAYALARLARDLPPELRYHSIRHTCDDVLPAVERLAALAGVNGDDELLLRTAVLYHDMGYMEQYANNEPIGARIAWETLPDFGYSPDQIAAIEHMIMATQMPQAPQNFLEELMCDADLDSLGREDYLETSHDLHAELVACGASIPLREWYQRQLVFLSNHTYFTEVARKLRDAGKQENIRRLKTLLQT